MNIKSHLFVMTGLIALSACAPKTTDTAADEAAIKGDPVAWMNAYNAGDADGVANLYAETLS